MIDNCPGLWMCGTLRGFPLEGEDGGWRYAPCPDDNQWSRQTSWHVASVGRCSDPATGHVTNVTQVHS